MKGINKVIVVGSVGKDPECKDFPNGGKVVTFSMATNETWTDKQTGEKKTATEWHRFKAKDQLADVIMRYVKKGMHLYVEGSLKTRQWTDQAGVERYTTEILIREMQMLDSKKDGDLTQDGQNRGQSGGYQAPNQNHNSQGNGYQPGNGSGYQSGNGYGYNNGFR